MVNCLCTTHRVIVSKINPPQQSLPPACIPTPNLCTFKPPLPTTSTSPPQHHPHHPPPHPRTRKKTLKTHTPLLKLHLPNTAILKRPLDNIRLRARALDLFARLQLAPELVKVGQLDQVPDMGERSRDDGGFGDGGGGGWWGGHCGVVRSWGWGWDWGRTRLVRLDVGEEALGKNGWWISEGEMGSCVFTEVSMMGS